jgi:hypothetical protein
MGEVRWGQTYGAVAAYLETAWGSAHDPPTQPAPAPAAAEPPLPAATRRPTDPPSCGINRFS